MDKNSPAKKVEDFFANVGVTTKGSSGFPLPGGKAVVLVRIPYDVAVSLCDPQIPAHRHTNMFQRFANAAADAVGRPGASNMTQTTHAGDVVATVRPLKLSDPDWSDESGIQAWVA